MKSSVAAAAVALALALGGVQAQTLSLSKQGLELRAADGRLSDQLKLRIKRWDQRTDAHGRTLAVAQDADSGRLLLLRADADGSRLRELARWAGPGFAPEQLCLYRDTQGLLQLFLLGEDGLSEHWLLDEAGRSAPRTLRRLATPQAPAACRVRDAEGALYIAEPGVGLWRYAADAERDGRRLLLADAQSDDKALVQRLDEWLAAHPPAAATAATSTAAIVRPSAQTQPVRGQGDAADDPAIWVHPRQGARSLILATDKKLGLAVYDLQGRERQFLPVGRINNVDLRQRLRYGREQLDLAVATQRDENALVLFGISAVDGRVRELARLPTGLDDIYGICVGRNAQGGLDAFPNDKDGRVQQLRLQRDAKGRWSAVLLRELRLPSQPEGCVVDEAKQQLFVGEEKRGIWRIALDGAAGSAPVLAIPTGEALRADVEGMAIHDSPQGRLLIVSSQGSDSYAVFDADAPHALRGAFRIGINAERGIDGASETDGLDVTAANLGGPYRDGLLVVQDGRKRLPQGTQNFKLVPWREVAKQLGL